MSWYATKKASKLPSMNKDKILVFDVETTGLNPSLDEIIQITILNGSGTTLYDSYIKPTHHKSWPLAEAVNHISYEMVESMPTFSEVRAEIQELFNKARLVVGYNVTFDINFVQSQGIIVSGQIFDVMTAFASYRADVDHTLCRCSKLRECAQYFGHSYKPHDSAEDADVTLECFNSLIGDSRFTTYTPKKHAVKVQSEDIQTNTASESISEQPEKIRHRRASEHRTSFTIQIPARRRFNIAVLGIVLLVISEVMLYVTQGTFITLPAIYLSKLKNIPECWTNNQRECILLIVMGIGCLLTTLGIIKMIIRLPRTILAKTKHFLYRLKR